MCCRWNTLGSVGLSRLCKCLLDLCLCLGLGEHAGPTGHGSLSLLLTLPSVSSLGEHLSLYLVMLHCTGCFCAVTGTRLGPWTPRSVWQAESWAGAAAGQSRGACGLWVVNTGLPQSILCSLSGFSALGCLLPESGADKARFHSVCIFFLLVMQCSASLDVLFLLDGSYSIGKGSFEQSKHFAGKLCDALDIHPDRVSVRNISSNFQTAQQCV